MHTNSPAIQLGSILCSIVGNKTQFYHVQSLGSINFHAKKYLRSSRTEIGRFLALSRGLHIVWIDYVSREGYWKYFCQAAKNQRLRRSRAEVPASPVTEIRHYFWKKKSYMSMYFETFWNRDRSWKTEFWVPLFSITFFYLEYSVKKTFHNPSKHCVSRLQRRYIQCSAKQERKLTLPSIWSQVFFRQDLRL